MQKLADLVSENAMSGLVKVRYSLRSKLVDSTLSGSHVSRQILVIDTYGSSQK